MICAYCGSSGEMTREHLIPKFIYEIQNSFNKNHSGWNEAAEKIVKGEAKIKDVCANCNNVILGELDGLAKKFLFDSGLLVRNYEKKYLLLKFEYKILLRWLLKISYNSSRLDGFHSSIHNKFLKIILDSSHSLPNKAQIRLVVSMNKGIDLREHGELRKPYIKGDIYNPFLFRVSYGANHSNDSVTHRIIIIGPAVFNIFIFEDHVLPGHSASFIRSFIKKTNGTLIEDKIKLVRVEQSNLDWIDLFRAQVLKEQNINSDYFQRLKFNKELFS